MYVYGHKGPRFGSFRIGLDTATIEVSAYAASESTSPTLLYSASNLTYARHSLSLTNVGAVSSAGDVGGDAFLLDFIQWTIQAAPAGYVTRFWPRPPPSTNDLIRFHSRLKGYCSKRDLPGGQFSTVIHWRMGSQHFASF